MTLASPSTPAIVLASTDGAASNHVPRSEDALSRSSSRTMQDRAAPPSLSCLGLSTLAAPAQPELKPDTWRRFLAAYRTGNWEAASQIAEAKDTTPTLAGPPPFRPCSIKDSQVLCPQGQFVDSLDFYKKFGFFAPPPPMPEDTKRRRAALRRHGFTKPQARTCLDRYVKHAKTILNADFAAVTVACTDEKFMLHLSKLGGSQDDGQPIAAHTICSHASLLGDHGLFIVPDIPEDWRFRDFHFTDVEGRKLRSYASAPVLVTAPPDLNETEWTLEDDSLFEMLANDERDDAESLVSVGRLTIMKREPWTPTEAEADLLRDVAQMCGEAIDNDWQKQNRMRLKRMQAQTAKLARMIETEDRPQWQSSRPASTLLEASPSEAESLSPGASAEAIDRGGNRTSFVSLDYVDAQTLRAVESIGKSMVEVLDADAISVVDVTSLRFAPLRRSGMEMERPVMPPRESSTANSYPSMPWLQSPSPNTAKRLETDFSGLGGYESRSGHATPPMGRSGSRTSIKSASENSYDAKGSGDGSSSSVLDSPVLSRPSLNSADSPSVSNTTSSHKRSASSFHAGPDELDCWLETTQGPRLFCHHGDPQLKPLLEGNTSKAIIVSYLKERRNQLRIRPTPTLFFTTAAKAGEDDIASQPMSPEDGEPATPNGVDDDDEQEPSHPLSLLMPRVSRSKTHLCIPIYDIEEQPLYLLMATIDGDRIVEGGDVIFASACAAILYASRLRYRAQQADRAQLDFLRSVSHEMRTPLNAIVGITDFIRQGMMPEADSDPVDLAEDGLLASMLESIRLAGSSLTSTLDDVLDLGAMTGVRSANRGQRIEQVNLRREIEEVCLDELEYLNLKLRQDHRLQNDRLLISGKLTNGPVLVINVASDLPKLWRADRSALRKILAKLVSNALRFTREGGLVEVQVRLRSSNRDPNASKSGTREVLFTVADNGIGMSKAFVRTQLLSPFAKGNSFTQGVGLGATIAASLTARLGGRFDVDSELGQGTRVRVTLPLTPIALHEQSQSSLDTSAATSSRPALRVRSAFFHGFDTPSLAKISDLLRRRLYEHGVRCVSSLSQADLVVFWENNVASAPALPAPTADGPSARIVVVTDSMWGGPEEREKLVGYPVHLFRPPYGPGSLDSMETFLASAEPLVLSMPPAKGQGAATSQQAEPEVKPEPAAVVDAVKAAAPQADPPVEEIQRAPAMQEDKTFKVLVVEDNPLNMKLLTAVLSKLNIPYREAHDGIEAVEQYRQYRPSVVLLDISLPLQDGFAACSLMRAHPLPHAPRIVAVTALSSHEDKARGIALGMNEWRTKPVSIKAIRADLVGWQEEWKLTVGAEAAPSSAAA